MDLNVNKLDSFMENMGFKIEEEEHKDLLNNLPMDGELLLVEFLIHM